MKSESSLPSAASATSDRVADRPASQSVLSKMLRPFRRGVEPLADRMVGLSEDLLSARGETSGKTLAGQLFAAYESATNAERVHFFSELMTKFGADRDALERAIANYQEAPDAVTAAALHDLAEPRRQELIRRMNFAPGAIKRLVDMRADLGGFLKEHPELKALDDDFAHLFSSWFNRGFLTLQRIDWTTSADILERIIYYEAVHAIPTWGDLRLRLRPRDRRCFAFFHPAMPGEPLIFVEVALTAAVPDAIDSLLTTDRKEIAADQTNTAVFYSISNCQAGLRGISFGSSLIKQVVERLREELPNLRTFVTLSPVPGLGRWLRADAGQAAMASLGLATEPAALLAAITSVQRPTALVKRELTALAYRYLVFEKDRNGRPLDPVARFHLGNGAIFHRLNWMADRSAEGLTANAGFMVNYLYDLDQIETNHESFANDGHIALSSAVRHAARYRSR